MIGGSGISVATLPGDGRNLVAAKVPGGEDEHLHVTGLQSAYLQRTVSQPLILREHDPATFSDRLPC